MRKSSGLSLRTSPLRLQQQRRSVEPEAGSDGSNIASDAMEREVKAALKRGGN